MKEYTEKIGAQLLKTSAKTGEGVNELFFKIADDFNMSARMGATVEEDEYNPVNLEKNTEEEEKNDDCCA